MIQAMTQFFIIAALVIFGIALLVCLLRLIKGFVSSVSISRFIGGGRVFNGSSKRNR